MSFDLKLIDGQLKLKTSGDLDTVFNTDKLIQDVTKIAITPMGANRLHSWYGSLLSKTLIGSPFDLEFAKRLSIDQLASALETLRILQISQAKQQNVSASEAISRILNVELENNKVDSRKIGIYISILSRSAKKSVVELVANP